MTADVAQHHEDVAARDAARRRLELLTPIAKAWPTDQGVRVASVALQVHGGAGFVEETGIAQRYRDIRIAPIYEGTNGIQAIDLVARKVARDHGRAAKELLSEIEASVSAAQHHPRLEITCNTLEEAVADARLATDWVVTTFDVRPDAVLAGASDYLELMALCVAGHLLLRRALSEPSAGATDGHARPSESLTRAELFALHQVSRRPRPPAIMSHLDVAAGALLAVC
jgi:hypothetical protein